MALISQQPIGESPVFHALMDRVSDIASLDRAVLLVGERGTGKELIASRLHFLSPRWEQVYVSLNCAAYNEADLTAELFGGVAPDGRTDIESIFIKGDGGTVFLDHIDACSPVVQEKLLQTLERSVVDNTGGSSEFDIRLICATSADLPAMADLGKFRADLLDAIAFHVLGLPPLRMRLEDIPPLSQHFGRKIVSQLEAERFSGFTPEAVAKLMSQSWPGNVRELKLCVERSVAKAFLADESLLMPIADLVLDPFAGTFRVSPKLSLSRPEQSSPRPAEQTPQTAAVSNETPPTPETANFQSRVMIFERGLIDEALTRTQGHQGRAADYLALSYHQFRGLLRKHGLKK